YRSSATENAVSLGTITGGANFTINAPGSSIITITNVPDAAPKTGGAIPATVKFQGAPGDFYSGHAIYLNSLKGYTSLAADIASGQDVNQVLQGYTPLMLAAGSVYGGTLNSVHLLINAGANVNLTNPEGMTALHLAAGNTFSAYGSSSTLVSDKI